MNFGILLYVEYTDIHRGGRLVENPFTPGFGTSPHLLVGRDQVLAEISRAFGGSYDPHRTTWLRGRRGSGKTVLLNEIQDLAAGAGWAVVQEDGQSPWSLWKRVAQRVQRETIAEPPRRVRSGGVSTPIGGVALELSDPEQVEATLRDVIADGLDQRDAPNGLLITVDEIHSASRDEAGYVGNAVQHLVRQDRPVALVVAGLPQDPDDRATFLGRCTKPELEELSPDAVRQGLLATAADAGGTWSGDAVDLAVTASAGYPYMLQLVGYWSWDRTDNGRIGVQDVYDALPRCDHELAGAISGLEVRLTGAQSQFLQAMAVDDGPSHTSDIGRRLDRTPQHVGKYRAQLIKAGVISEVARGVIDFAIPGHRARIRVAAIRSGHFDADGSLAQSSASTDNND
ncbi:MAG: ATP-binding protein [Actinomycetota bacterium]